MGTKKSLRLRLLDIFERCENVRKKFRILLERGVNRIIRDRIFFNFLVSIVCYFVLKITWGSIRGQRGKERGSFRGRYGDLFEARITSGTFNTGRWPIFL